MSNQYLFCQVASLMLMETVFIVTATWYQSNDNTVFGEVSGTAAEGTPSLKPFLDIHSITECVMLCQISCKKRPFYVETAKQCYCLGEDEDESKIAEADEKKKGSMIKEVGTLVNIFFFFSIILMQRDALHVHFYKNIMILVQHGNVLKIQLIYNKSIA